MALNIPLKLWWEDKDLQDCSKFSQNAGSNKLPPSVTQVHFSMTQTQSQICTPAVREAGGMPRPRGKPGASLRSDHSSGVHQLCRAQLIRPREAIQNRPSFFLVSQSQKISNFQDPATGIDRESHRAWHQTREGSEASLYRSLFLGRRCKHSLPVRSVF